ncbi:MAG: hypothetical protein Q8R47_01930 [Nanoarchaeota archaeon]|nr:hypothetical protein [Nanoarchaeota archaeon]
MKYAGLAVKHWGIAMVSDYQGLRQQARKLAVAKVASVACDRANERFEPVYQRLMGIAEECGYTERSSHVPISRIKELAGLEDLTLSD